MSKRSVQDTYLAPAEKGLAEDAIFSIDYTEDLAQFDPVDTIVDSDWDVEGSVAVSGSSFTNQTTSVQLSGGTKIGTLHRVTNTVTTSNGQTLVRLLTVKIMNIHVKRPEDSDVEFSAGVAL
jgi:hypothetical protein